jgi:hypothetical protein
MLHMAGFFPSVPMQLNFEVLYAPVDRQWKLFGISVNVGKGGPVAPEGEAVSPPEMSTEPPRAPTTDVGTVQGATTQ